MNQTEVLHFVTGKLAEPIVRHVVSSLSVRIGFEYSIDVLPITVAALMTPRWLLRHLRVPENATQVILPGYLEKGLEEIQKGVSIPVVCGPKDVRELPSFFGERNVREEEYGEYAIEILAEINYAPRLGRFDLIGMAKQLVQQGADRIDLGCDPSSRWTDVYDAVKACSDEGLTISIDTFDPWEAEQACRAGASLVLSVNRSNREAAADWGVEVVVVPDDTDNLIADFQSTIDLLDARKVRFRLDPILEPIGCGFANSLNRFWETRKYFPDAQILMGIGNLTELTDVDSAGINTILLGYCEELNIRSILTTQVINWARSSVAECDVARRLVHYANRHRIPPKRIEDRLVMLRDSTLKELKTDWICQLGASIRDNNYRIMIDHVEIHLLSHQVHLHGTDPFEIMHRLMELPESRNVDASHAFYLGFELAKARIALTLGKNYEQDESLNWGLCTRAENSHRLQRRRSNRNDAL